MTVNGSTNSNRGNGDFWHAFNWLFDTAMPALPTKAFRVLAVVYRQTWGWADKTSPTKRKMADIISYDQFQEKTGAYRRTVRDGINTCLEAGFLRRRAIGSKRGQTVWAYEPVLFCPWPANGDSNNGRATGGVMEPVTGGVMEPVEAMTGGVMEPTNQVLEVISKVNDDDTLPSDDVNAAAYAAAPQHTNFDKIISVFRHFANETNSRIQEQTQNRLALKYENNPHILGAWVRYVSVRNDCGKVDNAAGYLVKMLDAGDWPPGCFVCGRHPRKERICEVCGGPLCWQHAVEVLSGVQCEYCAPSHDTLVVIEHGREQLRGAGLPPMAKVPALQSEMPEQATVECMACGEMVPVSRSLPCPKCGRTICIDCTRDGLACLDCALSRVPG